MELLHRHRRLLLCAGALLAALAAWLLVPRAAAGDAGLLRARVVLVDASASVVRRRPDWLPWVRARLADEARAAAAAGQDLSAVVFAADVEQRLAPGPPERLLDALAARGGTPFDPSAADDGASSLAAALLVAEGAALDPRRPPGLVVLLGDGAFTGADPAATLARLAAGGAAVQRVEPPAPSLPDAALTALVLPPAVEPGAPLVARAELFFAPPLPARAVLAVEVLTPEGARAFDLALDAPPQGGALVVPLPLGAAQPGRTSVSARVLLDGDDPVPENDAAAAACVAQGKLVLGAVAGGSGRGALADWLARGGEEVFPGLQVLPLSPDELPGALADLDLLVTFDLALVALPLELLRSFVLRGGGWLAVAGFDFLADWDPGAAELGLHALLPLRPAPPGGARDVVLLVDGSGSMSGAPFELVKAAALELVAAAPSSDRVLLRFFAGALEPPHVLRAASAGPQDREATRAEAARALLAARAPGGPTRILASLEQLAEEREREAGEALVLLLSDGREPEGSAEPAERARALAARLRASRTALRVIAVGPEADQAFLAPLVAPGEELIRAEGLADLGRVFRREAQRARVVEGAAIAVRARAAGGPAEELLAPGDPPPLQRLVRCEARPGAEVLWESADGDPVLAAWRAGLGRAALLATAPRAGWADRWSGEAERFGPLLRWLGRDRPRDAPRARLAGGELLVEGLEPGWPPLQGALLRAPGDAAPPARLLLALAPEHPNDPGLGRRAARLPAGFRPPAPGGALVLEMEAPGGAPPLALAVSAPRAEEFGPARAAAFPAGGPGPARGAGGAERSASQAGPALLALSLALLFAGGLAGGRTRRVQAPGDSDR